MDILWDDTARARWDKLHSAAGAALQQDWAFGDAFATFGNRALRAEAQVDGRTVALAQFSVRSLGGFAEWALCTRGPVWLGAEDPDLRAEVIRRLRRDAPLKRPKASFFTPDEPDRPEIRAFWRGAGLRRVMTGYSTVLVNLGQRLEDLRAGLHKKWRNRLTQAEAAPVTVRAAPAKLSRYAWLLREEEKQRSERGYAALPTALTPAYAQRGGSDRLTLLEAVHRGRPIAAMLFLRHGQAATYHIGWSDADGRRLGAHNLLLWSAFERLQAAGVRVLDLGGVDTERGAGLARFKLGAGGEVTTLAGLYV
ncbi:MAG: GNAT family N-acetyltransferase [Pseudomonadota bacterium]